jgi:hypothetical protein
LGFPSGFVSPADYSCVLYCNVPDNWFSGDKIISGKAEVILEKMYGPNWRQGNEDGSYYVISSMEIQEISDSQVNEKIWSKDNKEDKNFRYWYYLVSAVGEVKTVPKSDF